MENMLAGLDVAGIGISVVFCFLAILVGVMFVMANVMTYINKLFPEALPANAPVKCHSSSVSKEDEIAVAILTSLLKNGSLK